VVDFLPFQRLRQQPLRLAQWLGAVTSAIERAGDAIRASMFEKRQRDNH
jgi:hypothetical protein